MINEPINLVVEATRNPLVDEFNVIFSGAATSENTRKEFFKLPVNNAAHLRDLYKDFSDLCDGPALPHQDIELVYPPSELNSASIVKLNSLGEDRFLEMLASTYTKTNRKVKQTNSLFSRRKINLIDSSGGSDTFIFTDDIEYWSFLRALKKACAREPVDYSGRCFVQSRDKAVEMNSSRRKSIGSLVEWLGTTNDSKMEDAICQISHSILHCISQSHRGNHTDHSIDLTTISAAAINADYDLSFVPLQIAVDTQSGVPDHPSLHGEVLFIFAKCSFDSGATTAYLSVQDAEKGHQLILFVPHNASQAISVEVKSVPASYSTSNNFTRCHNEAATLGALSIPLSSFLSNTPTSSSPSPVRYHVPLAVPDTQRVSRLVINGARDLNAHCDHVPSPYCVLYMMTVDGQTHKIDDLRTSTIVGDANPLWNHEFLLDTEGSDVHSIVIRIKDASSGLLRRTQQHLGEVVLPIGVFVSERELAHLRLPLEPTVKMSTALRGVYLGDISIGTQLVKLSEEVLQRRQQLQAKSLIAPSTPPKPSSPLHASVPILQLHNPESPSARSISSLGTKRSLGASNQSLPVSREVSTVGSIGITASVLPIDQIIYDTWWPCHDASQLAADHGGSELTTARIHKEGKWGGMSKMKQTVKKTVDGSCKFGVEFLFLKFRDLNSYESSASHEELPLLKPVYHWSEIISVDKLTDTVLMLSVGSVSEEKWGIEDAFPMIDIFVGPCPADILLNVVKCRVALADSRYRLKSFLQTSASYTEVSSQNRMSLSLGDRFVIDGQDTLCAINSVLFADPCCTSSSAESMSNHTFVRALMYRSLLVQTCHSVYAGLPMEYRGALKRVSLGLQQQRDAAAPWSADLEKVKANPSVSSVLTIATLATDIMCSCRNLVRHAVLFGPDDESEYNLLGDGKRYRLAEVSRVTERQLFESVNSHYSALRELLAQYVTSASAFQRVLGQDNKMKLLLFLVMHDNSLCELLKPYLSVRQLICSPHPKLLGNDGLKVLFRHYDTSLVEETRKWLTKTVQHSKSKKENKENFPWDIEKNGNLLISHLPEALRFQLNVYLGLCITENTFSKYWSELEAASISLPELPDFSDRSSFSAHSLRHAVMDRISGLNEYILRAICSSLLLLAEEYKLALQSKHWDNYSAPCDQSNNLQFLVSVGNDSFRVSSVHLNDLLRIESTCAWSFTTNALIKSVTNEFQIVSEKAVKYITRIIFSDLQNIISTNFSSMWRSGAFDKRHPASPIATIIATMKDFFRELKHMIDPILFFNVLVSCADVVVLRVLLFLKERAESNTIVPVAPVRNNSFQHLSIQLPVQSTPSVNYTNPLKPPEVMRLMEDVSMLVDTFRKESAFELHHHLNALSLKLSALVDAVTLCTSETFDGTECSSTFDRLVKKLKDCKNTDVLSMHRALVCLLRLRKDMSSKDDNTLSQLIDDSVRKTGESSRRDSVDDVILRAFHDSMDEPVTPRKMHFLTNRVFKGIIEKAREERKSGGRDSNLKDADMKRTLGLLDIRRQRSHDHDRDMAAACAMDVSGHSDLIKFGRANSVYDTVDITISNIIARNLRTHALFGKSNPYVVFTLDCNGVEQRQKTKVLWNRSNPQWKGVEITFHGVSRDLMNKTIHVKVYDKERIARKTLLGAVSVSFAGIETHPVDSWLALQGGMQESNAEIHLTIQATGGGFSSEVVPALRK